MGLTSFTSSTLIPIATKAYVTIYSVDACWYGNIYTRELADSSVYGMKMCNMKAAYLIF